VNNTQIEWVRNPDGSQGYTWNPITGCLNQDNGLCKGGGFPCYAYKLAHGRLKQRYIANHNILPAFDSEGDFADPFYPRFWEERLKEIDKRSYFSKAQGVFVCDMGDLFGIGVPEEWTRRVLGVIDEQLMRPNKDRFYLLTKQPQNLPQFSPFPDNCWVGVTATNEAMFLQATNFLYNLEAKVKFISIEPLLSWDTSNYVYPFKDSVHINDISWLIIGACTGTYAELWHLAERLPLEDAGFVRAMRIKELSRGKYTLQPKIEWVKEIVEAADKAGVKVFLKDNLRPLFKPNYEVEYPWAYKWGSFRQEMPE